MYSENARLILSGYWGAYVVSSSRRDGTTDFSVEVNTLGFRVASSFTGNDPVAIPEPASIALLGCGLAGFVIRRLRKN